MKLRIAAALLAIGFALPAQAGSYAPPGPYVHIGHITPASYTTGYSTGYYSSPSYSYAPATYSTGYYSAPSYSSSYIVPASTYSHSYPRYTRSYSSSYIVPSSTRYYSSPSYSSSYIVPSSTRYYSYLSYSSSYIVPSSTRYHSAPSKNCFCR